MNRQYGGAVFHKTRNLIQGEICNSSLTLSIETVVCGLTLSSGVSPVGRRISRNAVPSMSTSSCTRNDSVMGFLFFKASRAEKKNCKDERAAESSGRDCRYCTKTRAATYTQKDMKGFIYGKLARWTLNERWKDEQESDLYD